MKVLVTGIEGFVGRHLATILRDRDHKVCGTVWRHEDLELTSIELSDVPLEQIDLRYGTSFRRVLSEWDPDCIVHLAAQSSGSLAFREPVTTYRVNVLGTLNLLEAVRKANWGGRLLFVSSGEVYGNVNPPRLLLEDDPVAPVNHYATSKAMAEMTAEEYGRTYGVRVIRTRAFPHTGPGQSERFALSSFAKQIVTAEARGDGVLKVGNLDARRDYLDVRDVASAYTALLENGRDGEVYNVSRGENYRIGDLLDRLVEMSTGEIRIVQDRRRLRKIDIPQLAGDSSKLRRETDWVPLIGIGDTLRDLLDHWRDRF